MRPLRLFATALVALGTLLAGTTTADAAVARPVPHTGTSVPRAIPSGVRPFGINSSTSAGYEITGSGLTEATASWVQPYIDCSAGGSVALWAGLDNAEQIGTQVDCNGGNGHYYGFYELAGTKVTFGSVIPEDNMAASITQTSSGHYQVVLADYTQNWTDSYSVTDAAAQGASAEVMVSAGTTGGVALAHFGYNGFTSVALNNSALSSADTSVTLTDPTGGGVAVPTAVSATHNFGVSSGSLNDVTGTRMTAVQGGIPKNQLVDNWTPAGTGYVGQTILRNTNPALVILPDGGWEEAIMTAYKTLVIIGSDYTYNTGFPLAGGSSPSLAVAANGTLEAAFENPNAQLMTYTPASGAYNTFLPMTGSSTPSITALNTGGFEIAYVTNGGALAFTGPSGSSVTGNAVRGGTNPSIAAEVVSGYVYAFQMASNGHLAQGSSVFSATDQQIPMAAGTSPSVAWTSSGTEVAFEQSNGYLGWSGVYYSLSGPQSVGSSSPSISTAPALPTGFEIGYQTTGFQLALYDPSDGVTSTGLGMAGTGTSPSAAN